VGLTTKSRFLFYSAPISVSSINLSDYHSSLSSGERFVFIPAFAEWRLFYTNLLFTFLADLIRHAGVSHKTIMYVI
jgi:hypothetical protein